MNEEKDAVYREVIEEWKRLGYSIEMIDVYQALLIAGYEGDQLKEAYARLDSDSDINCRDLEDGISSVLYTEFHGSTAAPDDMFADMVDNAVKQIIIKVEEDKHGSIQAADGGESHLDRDG